MAKALGVLFILILLIFGASVFASKFGKRVKSNPDRDKYRQDDDI